MIIGIVLSSTPSYSETFFNSKIKGLLKQGFNVIVFTQKTNKDFNLCPTKKSPKVYSFLPLQLLSFVFVFLKLVPRIFVVKRFITLERQQNNSWRTIIKKVYLNAHILSEKFDWLHFGFAAQAIGSEMVASAIKAKMAVSFRGFDINVYPVKHPNCYDLLWQRVDKVHSISNYLLEKAYSLGLERTIPFKIITPAVVLEEIPSITEIKTNKIQLVTIARLSWIKGVDVAIDAMKLLKEKNIDFEYHIIGSGSIKDSERYMFQAFEYGFKKQIKFHGKLSHKETLKFLSQAAIYIQPSINEGFCNAVLEAQAMGKLCIVSREGGLPENILNNKTGWLVDSQNPKELANKIIEVLSISEATKQNISKNAIERIKTEFSIKKQQKEFVEFYTQEL